MKKKMTYEEAKNLIDDITWKYSGNSITNEMICECRDKCREALEKQIPKKPTPHIVKVERLKIGNARWGKGTTVYKCPCCNNFISRLYDYCFKCGQAIDWSDEI